MASREVFLKVKVHNKLFEMKVDTQQTCLQFISSKAKLYQLGDPKSYALYLPEYMDRSGKPMWLDHQHPLGMAHLREGDTLEVKFTPRLINVALHDGSAQWIRSFSGTLNDKYETYRFDFKDPPRELIPHIRKSEMRNIQKDMEYAFMCLLIMADKSKPHFWINSQVSLEEQGVAENSFLVLVPMNFFLKIHAEQLLNADYSLWMTKSSIKHGKQTPVKKRWCALQDGRLFYFKEQRGPPSGVVPLDRFRASIDKDVAFQFRLDNMMDGFRLSDDVYLYKCDSEQEFNTVYAFIRQHTGNTAGKSVFGVSIPTLMQRKENSTIEVPSIARKTFKYLANHMKVEGLFRLSGSSSEVAAYKEAFTVGENVNFDQDATDPHTIASLFKMWLRELPEPLLTYELYEAFVEMDSLSDDDKMETLPVLLDKLPETNKPLVYQLLGFCHQVSMHSEENKMTPKNLAIVFGPNLMRSSGGDLMSEAANSPAVNGVTEFMIEHAPELVETKWDCKQTKTRKPRVSMALGGNRAAPAPGRRGSSPAPPPVQGGPPQRSSSPNPAALPDLPSRTASQKSFRAEVQAATQQRSSMPGLPPPDRPSPGPARPPAPALAPLPPSRGRGSGHRMVLPAGRPNHPSPISPRAPAPLPPASTGVGQQAYATNASLADRVKELEGKLEEEQKLRKDLESRLAIVEQILQDSMANSSQQGYSL
eukprot:CAMPEP_0119139102 /NCGR_PEP_ID=MMETSP1310-20130426/26889_1 /TAXON_ID=464262 /ORGANISM="Genus nov. species nov., Strain RCC2339" /LENGTH=703 /DNA_ID=CAMNT_0007130361 /DNA_START=62 /DNA_END=2173 /DNA_ORIENTATION=+